MKDKREEIKEIQLNKIYSQGNGRTEATSAHSANQWHSICIPV